MENRYENKTIAREYSFKFLYYFLFEQDQSILESFENDQSSLEELLNVFNNSYLESDQEHPDNILNSEISFFSKQILGHAISNLTVIKEEINPHVTEKSKSKNKIEFALMILALSEYKTFSDTPPKVIINEAINLGKKFGTKESSSFINAVLDKIIKS